MGTTKKLWEYEHPYYCSEGNYYSNDCQEHFDSWEDFVAEYSDPADDLNLIWRFDWNSDDKGKPQDTLNVFMVRQRKAILASCHIKVKPADHDKIKIYLRDSAEKMAQIWAPFINTRL